LGASLFVPLTVYQPYGPISVVSGCFAHYI